MSDICVTVPQHLWWEWVKEGDLPGSLWTGMDSHFTLPRGAKPDITPGERVYIVAYGAVRGYAPLVMVEPSCRLAPGRPCLLRRGGAVAVTLRCNLFDEPCTEECLVQFDMDHPRYVRGFQGYRRRWWDRAYEAPFPNWRGN